MGSTAAVRVVIDGPLPAPDARVTCIGCHMPKARALWRVVSDLEPPPTLYDGVATIVAGEVVLVAPDGTVLRDPRPARQLERQIERAEGLLRRAQRDLVAQQATKPDPRPSVARRQLRALERAAARVAKYRREIDKLRAVPAVDAPATREARIAAENA